MRAWQTECAAAEAEPDADILLLRVEERSVAAVRSIHVDPAAREGFPCTLVLVGYALEHIFGLKYCADCKSWNGTASNRQTSVSGYDVVTMKDHRDRENSIDTDDSRGMGCVSNICHDPVSGCGNLHTGGLSGVCHAAKMTQSDEDHTGPDSFVQKVRIHESDGQCKKP